MKTMTCKQLGGACDMEFHANTFEQMAELSRKHGTQMFQEAEPAHMEAIQKMQALMQSPDDMQKWFEDKRKAFDALPANG